MRSKTSSTLHAICTSILQNPKLKKIDVYSVFRIITSKKNSLIIKEEYFDTDAHVRGEDLKDFISNVNPFFNYESDEKISYYKKYFNISQQIVDNCLKLVEESKQVAFYRVRIAEDKIMRFLTFSEIRDPDDDSKNLAEYETYDKVKKTVELFLNLYEYLKIPKSIEILGYNSQGGIIESEILNSL